MRLFLERHAFALLTACAALLVATLPVMPGHDIPQHLAFVRLLADWRDDPATYPAVFAPPDTSNGYATVYLLLARLSVLGSAETALRIVAVTYVVALACSLRSLVRATWDDDRVALLAPVAAFNPVLCMGLLPYLLSLPPLVACLAAVVRGRRRDLPLVVAAAALGAGLHAVSAAVLVVLAGAFALARRDRHAAASFGATLFGAWVGARAAGGGVPLPRGLGGLLLANARSYGVIAGTLGTFRVSFTHWLEKLNQIVASVLGPFPVGGKLLAAALLAFAFTRGSTKSTAVRGVGFACGAFAVLAALAPSAIQVPDDLSLLDFRLLTTAAVVGLAAVPPHWFERRRLAVSAALLLALWARQLRGAAGEVGETVRLVERLGPRDRVLALSMHDASAYLDERNSILHYAAVYHTVRNAGVTSLFWARFTPRLPIGYAAGHEPSRPPDWAAWETTDEQISDYSHLLVRWPEAEDDAPFQSLRARLVRLEASGVLERVASDGACTLFARKAQALSATFVAP